MSPDLRENQVVRVARLLRSPDHYNGWRLNQRAPRVDDVGTILDVLHAPGLPDSYVVECCGTDGSAVWLGRHSSPPIRWTNEDMHRAVRRFVSHDAVDAGASI